MKNTFKIKQEVKHFSWRFLTEWSDLEASAVITTLRWPPSPEDTLEHPYKHPSVTATNESFLPSPTVEWWEVSWVFPLFLSLPEKCCSAPHQAHAGNMRHSLQVRNTWTLSGTFFFFQLELLRSTQSASILPNPSVPLCHTNPLWLWTVSHLTGSGQQVQFDVRVS